MSHFVQKTPFFTILLQAEHGNVGPGLRLISPDTKRRNLKKLPLFGLFNFDKHNRFCCFLLKLMWISLITEVDSGEKKFVLLSICEPSCSLKTLEFIQSRNNKDIRNNFGPIKDIFCFVTFFLKDFKMRYLFS